MISLAQVADTRVAELAIRKVKAEIEVSLAPLRVSFRVQLLVDLEHFIRSQSVNGGELFPAEEILFRPEESLGGVSLKLGVNVGLQGIELVD